MFNEIGGNFWLKPEHWDKRSNSLSKELFATNAEDVFYTSSGRGAIRLYIKQIKGDTKVVLLPYFTCESVIEPFAEEGFTIFYYDVETDFSIDKHKLDALIQKTKPSVLYLQSYFGFDTLKNIKEYVTNLKKDFKISVVEDITHAVLSSISFTNADFYVASLRKWLEIPDGGVLISNNAKIVVDDVIGGESKEIVKLFIEASKLKDDYTLNLSSENKDGYRRLFYKAEDLLNLQKEIFPISQISKYILGTTDFSNIAKNRKNNYNFLHERLSKFSFLNLVFPRANDNLSPLYFCIECKGFRDDLQQMLASDEIYAPIIWPKSNYLDKSNNAHENFFYNDLLCIPCDQRYKIDSIKRIVVSLKTFLL